MGTVNIWIVRFVPYDGPNHHQLTFRTEATARKAFADAVNGTRAMMLKDDFAIELWVDPSRCALVLTNTHASAAFMAAVNSANEHAMRAYNLPRAAMTPGSSMQ